MKLFITSIFILFFFKVNAKDFTYKSTGTLERNEVTTFPGGGKFISFKHSGGFETDIGKYGKYQCNGSILYDNKEDKFEINLKRNSIEDAGIGKAIYINGTGRYLDFMKKDCTYAVNYLNSKVGFYQHLCKSKM